MEVKWAVILAIIVILSFFLGWLLSKKLTKVKKVKFDGTLLIAEEDDREQFRFIFDTELEDLRKQDKLIMRIEHSK